MAVEAERVSVGTSATALHSADAVSPQTVRVKVPSGGSAIDVGPSDVTSGSGFELGAGDSVEFELQAGEGLHGIIGTGSQTVHVVRTGVG